MERLQYLEHFLDCVDFVSSGRKGAISEDKFLVKYYNQSFYSVLQKHLKNTDSRVRIEVILLLTKLRERLAIGDIRELRAKDNENVASACLAYLSSVDEDDKYIPDLMDELKHKRGSDFMKAAAKMRSIGRKEDVPELRTIYGQTDGEMRVAVKDALEAIIDRNDDLRQKKDILMSVPVFPDDKAFMRFLDSTTVYLDIRYRDNVFPKDEISVGTYNNVASALKKIQIRLYNEKDNLKWYPPEAKEGYNEVSDLLIWAAEDIRHKKVLYQDTNIIVHDCKACGSRMACSNGDWVCPECGNKE